MQSLGLLNNFSSSGCMKFMLQVQKNKKGLPLKYLLLLDNTPTNPPGLENLVKEFDLIQVKFSTPNTAPI